ncbi:synaptogyrin-2 [Anolis carolinensis]|uniref:Synaptogyrin n=1 Tax=Anolis carolinensis TaxID=28377 RepID=G1KT11_ANOCA|nr:PREDICTED: synaptogyrin-2 [Anolis carolinensis]|eukprot:XP_003217178.1 PREDICTED: synaptogyrin-2 [Anolis carolinensis]
MEGGSVESGGQGDGGAYGAAKAGSPFNLWRFLQQPQVLARLLSALFALIVFSCIIGEGYTNIHSEGELHCIFNHNEHACRYGIGIGVVAFLACVFFFMVDIYFPQISNVTDRKYLVMADLGFSALWTFLWFIGFCVLTNQWASTLSTDVFIGADSARASIAFSFFSIFSWGLLITFALQRYRMGVQDFDRSYVDPAPGPVSPYSSFPNVSHDSYQQPPFTRTVEDSEGYQPPPVY